MSPADLAAILLDLAQRVRLQAIRKSPRRPKKPRPQGKKPARRGTCATAKLLINRQAKTATLTLLPINPPVKTEAECLDLPGMEIVSYRVAV